MNINTTDELINIIDNVSYCTKIDGVTTFTNLIFSKDSTATFANSGVNAVLADYTSIVFDNCRFYIESNQLFYKNNWVTSIKFTSSCTVKFSYDEENNKWSCSYLFAENTKLNTIDMHEVTGWEDVIAMDYMFYKTSVLTNFNMPDLYLDSCTTMEHMFESSKGIKMYGELDVSFIKSLPALQTMAEMFASITAASVKFADDINAPNLEDISGMFQLASKMTSLVFPQTNSHKINNVKKLFSATLLLKNLDVSNLSFENIIEASQCTAIWGPVGSSFAHYPSESIRIRKADYSILTASINNLISIPTPLNVISDDFSYTLSFGNNQSQQIYSNEDLVSAIQSDNCVIFDDVAAFYGCYFQKDYDISFADSSVQEALNGITKLAFISGNMLCNSENGPFKDTACIESIEFGKYFDLYLNNNLQYLDLKELFKNSTNLKHITLPKYKDSTSLENIRSDATSAFQNCINLESIDFGNITNYENCKHMDDMFNGCQSIKDIDMSALNNLQPWYVTNMFKNCSSLKNLNISSISFDEVTSASRINGFLDDVNLLKTLTMQKQYFVRIDDETGSINNVYTFPKKIISVVEDENNVLLTFAANKMNINNVYDLITAIQDPNYYSVESEAGKFTNCEFPKGSTATFNDDRVQNALNGITRIQFNGGDDGVAFMMKASTLFSNCSYLTEVSFYTKQLNFDYDDESDTWNLDRAFYNCQALKNVNFLEIPDNIDKLVSMNYIFANCTSLIGADAFDNIIYYASGLKSAQYAFSYSGVKEQSFNRGGPSDVYNLENLETVTGFYYGCKQLQRVSFERDFNVPNLKDISYFFGDCHSLTYIRYPSFINNSVLENLESMFVDCDSIGSYTITSLLSNTPITNVINMYYSCENLSTLNITNLNLDNIHNPLQIYDIITDCSNLETLIMKKSDYNTYNKSIKGVYKFKRNIASIDEDGDITTIHFENKERLIIDDNDQLISAITNPEHCQIEGNVVTFTNCTFFNRVAFNDTDVMEALGLENCELVFDDVIFDTISGGGIFNNAEYITSITFTDNVLICFRNEDEDEISMKNLFYDCHGLKSVTFGEYIDFSQVTLIEGMFMRCNSLETADLSSFSTASQLSSFTSLFEGTTNLQTVKFPETLELQIDSIPVSYMFSESGISSFTFPNIENAIISGGEYMFKSCPNLKYLDLSNLDFSNINDLSCFLDGSDNIENLIMQKEFYDQETNKISSNHDSYELPLTPKKVKVNGDIVTISFIDEPVPQKPSSTSDKMKKNRLVVLNVLRKRLEILRRNYSLSKNPLEQANILTEIRRIKRDIDLYANYAN